MHRVHTRKLFTFATPLQCLFINAARYMHARYAHVRAHDKQLFAYFNMCMCKASEHYSYRRYGFLSACAYSENSKDLCT